MDGWMSRLPPDLPFFGLVESFPECFEGKAVAFDVELEGGDSFPIPTDLEIHGPKGILQAL